MERWLPSSFFTASEGTKRLNNISAQRYGNHLKSSPKDANGEYMEFYGYMEYSQEIKE